VASQLCERQARRIKRLFAALFNLSQEFFDQLSRMSFRERFTPDIFTLPELIDIRDTRIDVATVFPYRSASGSGHAANLRCHVRRVQDATWFRKLGQVYFHKYVVKYGLFVVVLAWLVGGQQASAERGHTLLTSGSQVRVLLGSPLFDLTANPAATNTLDSCDFRKEVFMSRPRTGSLWRDKNGRLFARVTFTQPDGKRKDLKRAAMDESHARLLVADLIKEAKKTPKRRQPSRAKKYRREGVQIYCIQLLDGAANPIKIGTSANIPMRVKMILTHNPYPAQLLASWPGSVLQERDVHRMFEDSRIAREWFRPTPELMGYIESKREMAT